MNYGKNHVTKKQRNVTSAKVGKKIGFSFIKVLFLCFLAVIVLGTCAGFGVIRGLIASAPDISSLSVAPSESATYIYVDDKPVQKLTAPTSNRTLVGIENIPLHLQHAVVAVEDERFYTHHGIDIKGIARAFVVGVTSGHFSEGASTITQQLLKNNVFTDWMSETSLSDKFQRKFQEQYLALQLEKTMSKEQLLEDYLNTINLGAGAYGVQAAAHRYFNKDVSELTLSESTVIAGITQNPTQYNPIIYPEQNAKRREIVLEKMLEQNYISTAEYDEAIADDVYSRIQETDSQEEETSIYSYYQDALIEQVMDDLKEQLGYTDLQAYKAVYTSGLKIFSAQDETIQKICDEEFANPENYPVGTEVGLDYALSVMNEDEQTTHYGSEDFLTWYQTNVDSAFNMMFPDEAAARAATERFKNAKVKSGDTVLGERISLMPQPQASISIIDQSTGYVKAIVGGRGEKEASLTLNRATSTRRQPGSTFKILTTYAPALDRGDVTLATVFDNAPYAYSNGVEVKNWDSNNAYTGLTTIREAITNSINIVAVKCLTEITPRVGFEYAENFGISTLYNDEALDVRQPLALGGITDGVVNLELAAGFAAVANKGQYINPKFYTKIEDQNGNILIDNAPIGTTVLKESTAYLMTDAMEDVITNGTATGIDLGNMPTAGKTGTTSSYKDIWFAGYTPYYTCAVWGGYDNNDDLPSGDIYHSYHKKLWNAIMTRIHQDLPVKEFEKPDNIVTATVCKKSGKLAVSGLCSADPRGSMVYTESFVSGTEPKETCDVHYAVSVCKETGLKPVTSCTTINRVYIKRPKDSEGTTDDSNYTSPPSASCSGHTVIDKIKDIFKDPDKKVDEITTPNASDIKVPDIGSVATDTPSAGAGTDTPSGNETSSPPKAEEDAGR